LRLQLRRENGGGPGKLQLIEINLRHPAIFRSADNDPVGNPRQNRSLEPRSSSVRFRRLNISRLWETIFETLVVLAIFYKWIQIALAPQGDFMRHREFGRRFLAGEFLYFGGLDVPYPPFWAMVQAPLSLLPSNTAQFLVYPLAILSLCGLIHVLHRLARPIWPLGPEQDFWAMSGAVVLAGQFLLRDLSECGFNTLIVALVWTGIYFWSRQREVAAGLLLGLAAALKCTPVLFLAYFVLKRQWRTVVAGSVVALALTLAPAIIQPNSYGDHMKIWAFSAARGLWPLADPSRGTLGDEPLQNLAFRPALARFLIHLPDGHPGRWSGRGHIDLFDMRPSTAALIINALMIALLASVAFLFKGRVASRSDPRILWECAAISILMLLYSPITWTQHCVGTLPGIYLIARAVVFRRYFDRSAAVLLSGFVLFAVVPYRALAGRSAGLFLHSYHIVTFSLIALLLVVLLECGRGKRVSTISVTPA
jgi:alpha-1,2-mannosyltransferase